MQTLKRYRLEVALILIGIVWLFFFEYASQMSLQGILYPDSNSYRSAGENLYIFHRGDHYRPMLIAAIYGFPYLLGMDDAAIYAFSFWLNIVLWFGSLQILFSILKSFVSSRLALALTLVALFSVGNTAYLFHLLSETLFIFMLLASMALLLRHERNRDLKSMVFGLSILVLSILVRPGIQYFAVFTLLIFARILWAFRRQKVMWFFYSSIGLVLIQCAGLWHQVGNFTVSYIDAPTYYNYLGSRIGELKGEPPREFGYIYSLPMPEQKALAKSDMKLQLTTHPDLFFKAYEWNLRENATTGNIAIRDCKNVLKRDFFLRDFFFNMSLWQNRLFSIAGLLAASVCLMFRKRIGPVWGLMAIYVLYTILLSGISHSQGDRFTLATYPFTILLAARLFATRYTVR